MSNTTLLTNTDQEWSAIEKIAFRFVAALLVLFIFFNNNGAYPFFEYITAYPIQWMHKFIPWMAENVFHYKYDHTIFTNGSGDTSYDWVQLAVMSIASLIIALVWTVIDFRRRNYKKLYYWLLVLVRVYVAFTLFNYGMYKVIKLQFPYPSLTRLVQPYGDSSPMGLAWTFLGYSKGYNMFMGIVEVSTVLLLFRRTMVIGAFMSLAASVHVMSMNYFYDVPVKIVSTALVLMSLFVLAPYFKRLIQFFLTERSVALQVIEAPAYRKKWMYYSLYAFKYLMILLVVLTTIPSLLSNAKQWGADAPKPPLYGIYRTESFTLNDRELPPLTTDTVRWRELIVQRAGGARIKLMNDSLRFKAFDVDTINHKIAYYVYTDTLNKSTLHYQWEGKDGLRLSGRLAGDSVNILMRRVDLKKFRLINQDFRWVNEFPPNR